jgi:gas vesicle protein
MENNNRSAVSFLTGLLIGGAIAGIFSLLYAPMSGRKLRKRITRKTNEMFEDVNEAIANSKDKASEFLKERKDKANEIIKETKEKANEIIIESKKKAEEMFSGTKKTVA